MNGPGPIVALHSLLLSEVTQSALQFGLVEVECVVVDARPATRESRQELEGTQEMDRLLQRACTELDERTGAYGSIAVEAFLGVDASVEASDLAVAPLLFARRTCVALRRQRVFALGILLIPRWFLTALQSGVFDGAG